LLHFSPSGARLGSIQLPATLGTYLYWAVADGTLWLFYDQKAILAKVSLTHGLVGTEHVAPYYRMFINAGFGHLLFFNDSAVIFGSANVPFRSVKTVLGDFRGAQISSATIMPDGKIRFSLAGGTIVHITSSGEVMRCALPPDASEIVSMASVANGDWVASNNGDISFYTNTCVQRYRHHTGYYGGPLSLALSKTQTSLVFVSRDRNAIVELGLPKQ
jgi:hypothetical protein